MATLRDFLTSLSRRTGVLATAIVSADGLTIDHALGAAGDPEAVAALSATLARHAQELGAALGRGPLRAAALEYESGMLLLALAGPSNYVVVLADRDGDVGPLLHDLQQHEPAIAALL